MLICKFCNKSCKNKNSLINHERLCKENPERQESPFLKYKRDNPLPWNAGLKGDERCKHTAETKRKISEKTTGKASSEEKELIRVNKIRDKINARYANGWEPICGRCKKYEHISPIAGTIKVDGTWELKVAKYLDKIGVKWQRNKKRFSYTKSDGKISTYQPDFYISEWDSYLEIKGYETELDRIKWSQFPETLIVWKKAEIKNLDSELNGV